jgi:hypothetical protein
MKANIQIFRRLMVLQRQREQRNAQISYEQDNGGSDPISPDFWDGEEEERALEARLQASELYNAKAGPSNHNQFQTPQRQPQRIIGEDQEEEEDWAAEAARAEEAEREAEEVELARQVEESYRRQQQQHQSHPHQHSQPHGDTSIEVDDIEMDWDMDMDF